MPRVPSGHYAVEEVHAEVNRLENVARCADPHQVARLIGGHIRFYRVDDAVHLLGFLADRQTADGVTVAVQFRDLLHMTDTQILISSALIDPEQHLVAVDGGIHGIQSCHFRLTAHQPTVGTRDAVLDILIRGRVLDALVERHGNGGREVRLDLHTFFRPHEDALAVDMGLEVDPLLFDFPQSCEGKDLKPAAIGEDGAIPVHEFMESPHIVNEVVARSDMEVVGIGQFDLTADLPQFHRIHAAFDCGAGPDVHKHGCLDISVDGMQNASSRSPVLLQQFKFFLHGFPFFE